MIHKSDSLRFPGEPAPHHEERRHSNTQQEGFQQEQEEQEGRHAGAVRRGESAVLSERQRWALFTWPRDSPDLQPRTTPHPDPVPTAPLCLFTLHTPPQHWHGAHTGVKRENRLCLGIITLARQFCEWICICIPTLDVMALFPLYFI